MPGNGHPTFLIFLIVSFSSVEQYFPDPCCLTNKIIYMYITQELIIYKSILPDSIQCSNEIINFTTAILFHSEVWTLDFDWKSIKGQ